MISDHVMWTYTLLGNHYTKFGNYQAKGPKDIEQPTLGLQTDQPTGAHQYAPLFQKGRKNSSKVVFFFY